MKDKGEVKRQNTEDKSEIDGFTKRTSHLEPHTFRGVANSLGWFMQHRDYVWRLPWSQAPSQ